MEPGTMIDVEADTLDEAREIARSQIPAGFTIFSGQVISDGKPLKTVLKTLRTEANSVSEAFEQVKPQIPLGLQIVSTQVVFDNENKKASTRETADSVEAAYAKVFDRIPKGCAVLVKKVITAPEQKNFTVEAFNEQEALSSVRSIARNYFGTDKGEIRNIKLTNLGSKGFLGVRKQPNRYEAEVVLPACIEVVYRPAAVVEYELGKVQSVKAKVSYLLMKTEEAVSYYIEKQEWDKCVQIGLPSVPQLIAILENGVDFKQRAAAANALGMIGDASAVVPLVSAINPNHWSEGKGVLWDAAAKALCRIGEPAIAMLINGVDIDENDEAYKHEDKAAEALVQIGIPAVKPLIIALCSVTHKRKAYSDILINMRWLAVEPLIDSIEHTQDPLIRQWLLFTLAGIRDRLYHGASALYAGSAVLKLSSDWEKHHINKGTYPPW